MIVQNLNSGAQPSLPEGQLEKALVFLRQNCFEGLPAGRIDIDGNRMFAVLQSYDTRDEDEIQYESHRLYADVQYMISGREKILISDQEHFTAVSVPYDEAADIVFYQEPRETTASLILNAGRYAVFLPEDCHKTQCSVCTGEAAAVRKVIVKIRLRESE